MLRRLWDHFKDPEQGKWLPAYMTLALTFLAILAAVTVAAVRTIG